MIRSRVFLSMALMVGIPTLVSGGCKKGEKDKAQQETKPTEVAPKEEAPKMEKLPPVTPDVALIDKTLHALADATLAKASQEGEEGGLPPVKGREGISCGEDPVVNAAIAHIAFDPAPLKAHKGFPFSDVCVGWRPFIKPVSEMFWMISAGPPDEGTGLMPHRRCLRVHASEGKYVKAEIMDGLCLSLHIKEREAAIAGEKAEKEAAAAKEQPKK